MKDESRRKYWAWGAGDVTITFPEEEKKKAQDFNAIKNKKKELKKDEKEQ